MGKLISFCVILCTLFSMGCEHTTSKIDTRAFMDLEKAVVEIGSQSWVVEVANTSEERQRGLMFRESIGENEGMLFIFPNEAFQGFWMKNTLIPLDVIWISGEGKVVDIQTLQPCDTEECSISQPIEKAQYVLEVGAESFEGGVGNSVKIEKEKRLFF